MPTIKRLKSPYVTVKKSGKWSDKRDEFLDSVAWRKCRKLYIETRVLSGADCCDKCGYIFRDVTIKRHGKQFMALDIEVDHITPRSQGGDPLEFDNLQLLCKTCHTKKTRKEINGNRDYGQ